MELKKANGFDVVSEGGVTFENWMKHINTILNLLGRNVHSVYEVGCGSGANLVMFQKCGIPKVGGMDYSENLTLIAAEVTQSKDIICCDALDLPEMPMYDVTIADSVTQYFPSIFYAEKVFEKMEKKAAQVMALLDVHDAALREEWIKNRRNLIENYDEKYAGLDDSKLFIEKDYFRKFANNHNLELAFYKTDIADYWNGRYTYSVFMNKRNSINT